MCNWGIRDAWVVYDCRFGPVVGGRHRGGGGRCCLCLTFRHLVLDLSQQRVLDAHCPQILDRAAGGPCQHAGDQTRHGALVLDRARALWFPVAGIGPFQIEQLDPLLLGAPRARFVRVERKAGEGLAGAGLAVLPLAGNEEPAAIGWHRELSYRGELVVHLVVAVEEILPFGRIVEGLPDRPARPLGLLRSDVG